MVKLLAEGGNVSEKPGKVEPGDGGSTRSTLIAGEAVNEKPVVIGEGSSSARLSPLLGEAVIEKPLPIGAPVGSGAVNENPPVESSALLALTSGEAVNEKLEAGGAVKENPLDVSPPSIEAITVPGFSVSSKSSHFTDRVNSSTESE